MVEAIQMWVPSRSRSRGRRAVAVDIGTMWVRACLPGGRVVRRSAGGSARDAIERAFAATGAAAHPDVVLCAPTRGDAAERRHLEEDALRAGARAVLVIDTTLAAAIACGLPVADEHGCLVADIGAGRCEATHVADGAVATAYSRTCGEEGWTPEEVAVDTVLRLLEDMWRATRVDTLDRGLTVVGGGAMVPALIQRITEACPVDVWVPYRADERAVRGAARVFDERRVFSNLARRR